MTNSASDPGDEDVLASIRRLVASTPDRPNAANGAPSGAFSGGASGDRLLLTPALRVAEPEAGGGAPVPPAPRGLTLEDRIAELEAAVGSQASEFEPDGSEVAHLDPPEELVRAVENLEIDGEAETADEGADASRPEPSQDPSDPEPERRGLFLAASTAVPGAGSQGRRPEPSSAEALTDLPAGLFFTRHDRVASATPVGTTEAGSDTATGPAPDSTPEAPTAWSGNDERAAEAFTPSNEEVEDAAGPETAPETGPQSEPGSEGEATPEFRHAGGITASPAPASDTAAMPEDAAPAPWPHPAAPDQARAAAVAETLLDEEKLREIVAELLRDELQGPLGEKITRNIRKLVRREIERALTVRDFD